MRFAEENYQSADDFKTRERLPTILQFTLTSAVIFGLLTIIYFASKSATTFLILTGILMLISAGISVYLIQKDRDMLIATEFQNAIFSSAINIGNEFYFITHNDSQIVYYNHGVRRIVPGFDKNRRFDIDNFIIAASLNDDDANRLTGALSQSTPSQIVITITNKEQVPQAFMLSIDPISRPANYFLIRGRHYVHRRNA